MPDYSHHECLLTLVSAGRVGCIETYGGGLSLPWVRALEGEPAAVAGERVSEITGYLVTVDGSGERIFKVCNDGVARTLIRGKIVGSTLPTRLAGGYFRWVNLDEALSRLTPFESASILHLHGQPHA